MYAEPEKSSPTATDAPIFFGDGINGVSIARCYWDNSANTGLMRIGSIRGSCYDVEIINCYSGSYNSVINCESADMVIRKGNRGGGGTDPLGTNGNGQWAIGNSIKQGNPTSDYFVSATKGLIATMPVNGVGFTATSPVDLKSSDYGRLILTTGQVVEVEQTYFALGHTGLTKCFWGNGYANENSQNTYQFTVEFQYQKLGESWNGTWLDASVSSNFTSVDTTDMELGIKLKFRITGVQPLATSGYLEAIGVITDSSISAQASAIYPIDQVEYTVTIPDAPTGALVVIYDKDNVDPQNLGTELQRTGSASGNITYTYDGTKATDDIYVTMYLDGYRPVGKSYTLPAQDSTLFLEPQVETN